MLQARCCSRSHPPLSLISSIRRQWSTGFRELISVSEAQEKSPCSGDKIGSVGSHFLFLETPHTGQLRESAYSRLFMLSHTETGRRPKAIEVPISAMPASFGLQYRALEVGGCSKSHRHCLLSISASAGHRAKSPHEPRQTQHPHVKSLALTRQHFQADSDKLRKAVHATHNSFSFSYGFLLVISESEPSWLYYDQMLVDKDNVHVW